MVQPGHVYCPECGKAMYEPGDHSCEEELLQSRIDRLTSELEDACRKSLIDQRQCDEITSEAGRLATELRAAEQACNEQKGRITRLEKILAGCAGLLLNEFTELMEAGEVKKSFKMFDLALEIFFQLGPDSPALQFFSKDTHELEVQ
jgi:hypothetical protein